MKWAIKSLLIGSGWLLAVAWYAYAQFLPSSLWVSMSGIKVPDGTFGGPSPIASAAVEYHKTMLIRWHRTLLKLGEPDDWVPVCITEGEGIRYAGYVPPPTSLEELFANMPCAKALPIGEYYLEVDIEWNDLVARSAFAESNVFVVSQGLRLREPAPPPDEPKPRHVHKRPPAPKLMWPFSVFFR